MKKYKGILLLIVGFLAGYVFSVLLPVVLAHGGDTNFIHGCVRNNGLLAGFVRIVGANTNCNNNETALDWKQGLNEPPFSCPRCDFNQNGNDLGSKFAGKNLSNAFLQGAGLGGVDLSGTIFINAYLRDVGFSTSNLNNTNFTNANLISSTLSLSNLTNTNLTGANLTNADASLANFSGANLTNANLTGTGLLNATNMDTATLTGVIWSNTTCPDGTNSDNNGGTCVGHLTP